MKIETAYEVGQKIWIVYANKGEVCLYDDVINEISITNEDKMLYITKESCQEIEEDDIILYDDTINLLNRIKSTMKEIHNQEKLI